jgi:hypothetical protein
VDGSLRCYTYSRLQFAINNNPIREDNMSFLHRTAKLTATAAAAMTVAVGCATSKQAPQTPAPKAAAPAAAAMPAEPKNDVYTVVKGDCLWCISGKSEIYNDPYQWPVIYRANRDQIKDADLIYPGQELAIDRNASDALKAAADKHARNRGAWAIGVVEESDKAYLNNNP